MVKALRIPALAVMFYLIGLMFLVVDWTLMETFPWVTELDEWIKQQIGYTQ